MELSLKLLDEQALLEQDADLLTSIGYALETGTVFEQNYVLAAQIYSIAEQMIGGEKALNNLAWLMLNGFGIEQNIPRAIELFTKAAEAGDTTAMVNLGNIYPSEWKKERIGVSYAIRSRRDALVNAIQEADILESGIMVTNPMIGVIPSMEEIQEELDQLLMSM